MKIKNNKKKTLVSLSVAAALFFCSGPSVYAGTAYELYQLVEGSASPYGLIPASDPAQEWNKETPMQDDPLLPEESISSGEDAKNEDDMETVQEEGDVFDDGSAFSSQSLDEFDSEPSSENTILFSEDEPDIFTDEEMAEPEKNRYTTGDFPVSYSLFDEEYTTFVKNQGTLNICWAFSALESIETGMIHNGLVNYPINLSETHLSYTTFHGTTKDTGDPTHNETFFASGANWTQYGGNRYKAVATLSRGYGPALDRDYPLSMAFTANAADRPGSETSILDDIITDRAKRTSVARLSNCYWLPDINDAVSKDDRVERVNTVKSFIYHCGGVETGLYVRGFEYPYDPETNSFYNVLQTIPSHSVTLIGWDDEKVTAANTPGAFLVQNSWGTECGEKGLFWVSYEDQSLSMISFYEMEAENSGNLVISQYDGTGYGSVITPQNLNAGTRISGANVFTSQTAQYLNQVSFYAADSNLPYTISIYRYVKEAPDTGTLVYTQSGSNQYAGYYTISLEQQIPIAEGEKFAVQLQFDSDYGYVPHEKGAVDKLYSAESGQSYLYDGKNWTDMMELANTAGSVYACNLCIKAIGTRTNDMITIAPSRPSVGSANVTGGNGITAVIADTDKGVDGYDFVLGSSKNFLSKKSYIRINKNVTGKNSSFTFLPRGTYYIACHAYRKNSEGVKIFSPWSDVVSVKITAATPTVPTIKSVSSNKGYLSFTYKAASSAYRYEYILTNKKFGSTALTPGSRYKLYTGQKFGKAELKNLAKGTYYLGVRAYSMSGKTKVYGKWSVKAITVK